MKEFLRQIITNQEINDEEKIDLINKIINVVIGRDQHLNEDLFLKPSTNEQTRDINLQLWYKYITPEGKTSNKNTGYNNTQIINIMHEEYIKKEKLKKQKKIGE